MGLGFSGLWRLWICVLSTPASVYLQVRQTAREGSGVVISLGTEVLKAPQHGILSALPCMAVSGSTSACWRSYGAPTLNCSVVQPGKRDTGHCSFVVPSCDAVLGDVDQSGANLTHF